MLTTVTFWSFPLQIQVLRDDDGRAVILRVMTRVRLRAETNKI